MNQRPRTKTFRRAPPMWLALASALIMNTLTPMSAADECPPEFVTADATATIACLRRTLETARTKQKSAEDALDGARTKQKGAEDALDGARTKQKGAEDALEATQVALRTAKQSLELAKREFIPWLLLGIGVLVAGWMVLKAVWAHAQNKDANKDAIDRLGDCESERDKLKTELSHERASYLKLAEMIASTAPATTPQGQSWAALLKEQRDLLDSTRISNQSLIGALTPIAQQSQALAAVLNEQRDLLDSTQASSEDLIRRLAASATTK